MLTRLKEHYWRNHWFIHRALFGFWCVVAMWGLLLATLHLLEGQTVRGVVLLLAHGYCWMLADFQLRLAYSRQRYLAARKLFFAQSAANAFAVFAQCTDSAEAREKAFRELDDCVDAFCGYYAWWLSGKDTERLTVMGFWYAQLILGIHGPTGERVGESDYAEIRELLEILGKHKEGGRKNETTK